VTQVPSIRSVTHAVGISMINTTTDDNKMIFCGEKYMLAECNDNNNIQIEKTKKY